MYEYSIITYTIYIKLLKHFSCPTQFANFKYKKNPYVPPRGQYGCYVPAPSAPKRETKAEHQRIRRDTTNRVLSDFKTVDAKVSAVER